MAEVEYSDGEVLFNKKDSATNFYVLKSGEIELFDPDTNKIADYWTYDSVDYT